MRCAAFLRPGSAWWKGPKPDNMKSVDSVQQLVDELDAHKEGLVVVEVSTQHSRAFNSRLSSRGAAAGLGMQYEPKH